LLADSASLVLYLAKSSLFFLAFSIPAAPWRKKDNGSEKCLPPRRFEPFSFFLLMIPYQIPFPDHGSKSPQRSFLSGLSSKELDKQ